MNTIKKPIAPIQRALCHTWLLWILYRFIGYPLVMSMVTSADFVSGVLWQILVLLPVMGLTPSVWRGNSPYALIITSLVILVYLATIGVFLLMRIYEGAPWLVCAGLLAEMLLVLLICGQLFILLKRLPPMYKMQA